MHNTKGCYLKTKMKKACFPDIRSETTAISSYKYKDIISHNYVI